MYYKTSHFLNMKGYNFHLPLINFTPFWHWTFIKILNMLNETFGWRAISYTLINIRIYASLEEESANVSILVCLDLPWVISMSSTSQPSLDFSNSIAMAWHLLLLICRWSCNIKYLKLLYKVCKKPRHFFYYYSFFKTFHLLIFKMIATKILRPCKWFWLKITAIFSKFLRRNEGSNKRNIQAKLTFFLEYNITMKNIRQSLKYTEWFVTEFLPCV